MKKTLLLYIQNVGSQPSKCIRAYNETYYHLTNYISGEIAESLNACEEELGIIDEIEREEIGEYDSEGIGNACGIIMNKEKVGIYMYNEEDNPTYYPFYVFKKAVEEWYHFIKIGEEKEIYF